MAGVPSPTDNSIVEAVRSASKRILGTGIVNRKEPISSSLIHDIMTLLYYAILLCMFCHLLAFFRFDDVSRIRKDDIFFNEGFMVTVTGA